MNEPISRDEAPKLLVRLGIRNPLRRMPADRSAPRLSPREQDAKTAMEQVERLMLESLYRCAELERTL